MDKQEEKHGFCAHCGGEVDAEGYAKGGEVLGEAEEFEPFEKEETDQHEAGERMRDLAFAKAVSRRAR